MPCFVSTDWATRFLPTLYHHLFYSEKPFHKFSKGSALLAIIQSILDLLYPNNSYVVTANSKVYLTVQFPLYCCMALTNYVFQLQAYDRLTKKRSDFGTRAVHIAEQFFKQPEFKDDPRAVSKYAIWATRRDGPAFWRVPSPQGLAPNDPNYTVSTKIFISCMAKLLLLLGTSRPF